MTNRVFIDMDGVIVDFDGFMVQHGLTADQIKQLPGAYARMQPIQGAIEAVREIMAMGYEVFLATKPPTGVAHAYSDKAGWVFEHLPELRERIIITHDKGLLGDTGDFLCDDRPGKANCDRFQGTLLRFTDGFHWPQALKALRNARDQFPVVPDQGVTLRAAVALCDEWLAMHRAYVKVDDIERWTYLPEIEGLKEDLEALLKYPCPTLRQGMVRGFTEDELVESETE